MNYREICRQVFTGRDNETVAWGRVMGAIVFVLFIMLGVPVGVTLVALKVVTAADLVLIMGALATYIPAMAIAACALVAGTYFAEPKP
jgi:hypothetical protein